MVVVDTNVLVYAADEDSPFHAACRAWLERQRTHADAWYSTWPILYEFLRVTTHARVMRHPWSLSEAWRFVTALLASPGLDVLGPTHRDCRAGLYGASSPDGQCAARRSDGHPYA